MTIKDLFRWFLKIGVKAGAETVAERVESGPITTGNILKPAAGEAAAAITQAAVEAALAKKKPAEKK